MKVQVVDGRNYLPRLKTYLAGVAELADAHG